MTKTRIPKYRWYVLTPSNHAKGELPRRHAVHPDTPIGPGRGPKRRAICGGEIGKEAFEIQGTKTIASHPVCGRCEAKIERFQIMQDGGA